MSCLYPPDASLVLEAVPVTFWPWRVSIPARAPTIRVFFCRRRSAISRSAIVAGTRRTGETSLTSKVGHSALVRPIAETRGLGTVVPETHLINSQFQTILLSPLWNIILVAVIRRWIFFVGLVGQLPRRPIRWIWSSLSLHILLLPCFFQLLGIRKQNLPLFGDSILHCPWFGSVIFSLYAELPKATCNEVRRPGHHSPRQTKTQHHDPNLFYYCSLSQKDRKFSATISKENYSQLRFLCFFHNLLFHWLHAYTINLWNVGSRFFLPNQLHETGRILDSKFPY